jgi:hypothetical protein
MLLSMIGTTTVAWSTDTQAFSDFFKPSASTPPSALYKFDLNYLYLMMPLVCYALIFHYSVPTLSQAIREKEKLATIFAIGMIICAAFYAAVGASVSLYFGDYVFQSSNINWTNYVGDVESTSFVLRVLTKLISFIIVFFPAFDVISIYPLCAITLGNNLMSIYYDSSHVHDEETSRGRRSIFRLIASVPPIIVSFFVRDLSKINGYAGVTGFLIAFLFPPLLAHYSDKYLQERNQDGLTVYSHSIWTGYWMRILMMSLSIFLVFYTLYFMM